MLEVKKGKKILFFSVTILFGIVSFYSLGLFFMEEKIKNEDVILEWKSINKGPGGRLIHAAACNILFCFNCPDSSWFPERFALFIVLTFQFVLLLPLLKQTRRWPAYSGWKYRCHVNLQQSKPGNKDKWIFGRCSKSLKKVSSGRTKTNI